MTSLLEKPYAKNTELQAPCAWRPHLDAQTQTPDLDVPRTRRAERSAAAEMAPLRCGSVHAQSLRQADGQTAGTEKLWARAECGAGAAQHPRLS